MNRPLPPHQRRHVVQLSLPEDSQYLDSVLQLRGRIALGLDLEELMKLLQAVGHSPRCTPAESGTEVSIQLALPQKQVVKCQTARVTLH